ncbi:hypothetical protein BCR42DRAFT_423759 [Absidia repens]|uniref:Uncharacterized protein n=1 Tax=Absidia repens TaxID=90262 RepID=A0A1X2I5C9_9FUNG|nr:hypothetical protein BCR42DRAFT_423759 [Absidia repens]
MANLLLESCYRPLTVCSYIWIMVTLFRNLNKQWIDRIGIKRKKKKLTTLATTWIDRKVCAWWLLLSHALWQLMGSPQTSNGLTTIAI